jgi:MATE family multidrug resistance protein
MRALPYRALINLAWPSAIAMLGETCMGLVDTKLVGGLGPVPLAAVGVGASLFFLVFVTMLGFMRGIKVCTAYALGEGRPEISYQYALIGAVLVGGVGAVFAGVLQHTEGYFMWLGIKADVAVQAASFLSARCLGLPAACAVTALTEHRQGLGVVKRTAAIGVFGNVFNVVVSYGLIYGEWGLPRCGVQGPGYGSACSETLQLLIAGLWLLHSMRHCRVQGGPSALASLKELCRLGIPTALHFGFECLAFVSFTAILGGISHTDMASHQIALAVNRTAFLPGLAVSEAVSVLVGQSLGRGDVEGAKRAVAAGLRVAMAFMAVCGLCFAQYGRGLAALFTKDPEIMNLTAELLLMAGLFQLFDAINLVMRAALRGAKDVQVPAVFGIAVLWACVPSAAYFLGKAAGWGVLGGWCGLIAETVLASAFFSWRWQRGAWQRRLPRVA